MCICEAHEIHSDPLRLSKFLLQQAMLKGVHLHQPVSPLRLSHDGPTGCLSALRVRNDNGNEYDIPCTRLLIAAGAWTPSVYRTLFPESKLRIDVSHLAGHSLVVKSPRWTREHESNGCHAVFSTTNDGFSPEIFSRVGEEIYIAGLNDASLDLPRLATEAKSDQQPIEVLTRVAQRMLGKDGTDVSDLEVLREGLCFRPTTRNGDPIIVRVLEDALGKLKTSQAPGAGGVFIAAGHGPWGISMSLGTGNVMQEMMEGVKEPSADIRRLGLQR
jgi:glycine/D-amino acid oxidase-like deaminating enzyme